MEELFNTLAQRYGEGKDSVLVTIVEGSGSIPRTVGAYMVVGEEGRVFGTIGGGNLEYQAILTGEKLVKEQKNYLQEYNLAPNKVADLGMVCGGKAKVLFYFLGALDEISKKLIETGVSVSSTRKPYWLLLPLGDGVAEIAETVDSKKHQLILKRDENEYYAEQFSYDGKVYVFGGGHVTQETVPVLSHVGFRCIVADDRDEFTNPVLFPGAENVVKIDFKNIEDSFTVTKDDYIVVMTRGHLCDTDVERFALKTPADYIGIVGSHKKAKFVREKLLAEGFSEEELNRVITPIGLDIKAETPAEIAISIAAQLIQFRQEKYQDEQ